MYVRISSASEVMYYLMVLYKLDYYYYYYSFMILHLLRGSFQLFDSLKEKQKVEWM